MYTGYGKEAIRSTNVTIGLASLVVRLVFYAMLPVRRCNPFRLTCVVPRLP